MQILSVLSILALLTICARCQAVELTDCGLLGPVYPVPANLTGTDAIRGAQSTFQRLMDEALQNGTTPWSHVDAVNTTISIGVFSMQSDDFVAQYQYTGSNPQLKTRLSGGKLDTDTLYRLRSVTKLLTVYTFLAKLGTSHWSEPVANFIPELASQLTRNSINNFNWSAVTLGSLAGQMSGLPHDYALGDVSSVPGVTLLGLPPLNASEIITCGQPGLNPCSVEVASDGNENITGEALADAFEASLVKTLKLKRTFWSTPKNDSNIMAGGAWASVADFSELGRSILQSSILPKHLSREWLKPISHSEQLFSSVGRPWEIARMDVPVSSGSNNTRVVDLYTKSGGYGGYNSWLFLSPDHEIGIAVLVASISGGEAGSPTLFALSELALATWIPAAEAAAREAAAANYVGTFASEDGLNSSVSLEVVPDHQGMRISQLVYNGTDILELLSLVWGKAGGSLQYMSLQDDGRFAFRAIWQTPKGQYPASAVLTRECNFEWSDVDTITYGNIGLDDFIISVDTNGKATGVEVPALRASSSKRIE
ncbi:hypothetical protein LTR10_014384 [Elasticomyces elasticus]|uniref:Beta-lactamase-related domain-containing protein n=1 Tax=Exophiala sideris TaxID=1016849 RepID=A0ABR0J0E2_9EURO|nr:hypothetical protein LTR10_014384 [Elasticomyces elasticus]KAK5023703.1 hypothetical protein LTS07_009211 [Exophiala sideris]KAK5029702.1 hypothetical protein LTR13_008622 [Exophiala sideris]KAK5053492.1 hypothetical protein LTR69_009450 [Exophiala sideris]KAK5179250.1 hypothetical protein LTR44_008404 [Eurotiomycetes sp. CCFEE 6388]